MSIAVVLPRHNPHIRALRKRQSRTGRHLLVVSKNASANHANGWLSVEADEYELYLSSMMGFGFSGEKERLTAEEAVKSGAAHRSSIVVDVSLDCLYPQVDRGRRAGDAGDPYQ